MTFNPRPLAFSVAALASISSAALGQNDVAAAPAAGKMAPTFTLKSLDGKFETDLASFRGKRPFVLFFGSYT